MVEPEYLNAQQAAEHLGLTRQRIYALSNAGKIGKHIAGFWLYTKLELDAWRATSRSKGGRPPKSERRPLVEARPA